MAEMKAPIKIDGFKCVEDMVQAVLNYTYKEKTLKEWADRISKPHTNADRIRALSDEELAQEIWSCHVFASFADLLDWLKKEVKEDE